MIAAPAEIFLEDGSIGGPSAIESGGVVVPAEA
jgi:hypothetical protein